MLPKHLKAKRKMLGKAGESCCFEIQCIINNLLYSSTACGLQFTLTLVFHSLKILTYAHKKSPHVAC